MNWLLCKFLYVHSAHSLMIIHIKLSSLIAKRDNSNREIVLCVKEKKKKNRVIYNFNLKQVAVDINYQRKYI